MSIRPLDANQCLHHPYRALGFLLSYLCKEEIVGRSTNSGPMNNNVILNRRLLSVGIPLLVFAFLVYLMRSSFLGNYDGLELAITADLLLTVPFVYYLLIRKTNISKTSVLPIMLLGLFIGSYFMPKESQTYLNLFKLWALPLIELALLGTVVYKVRKAVLRYRALKGQTPDFFDTLKNACAEVLPKGLVLLFVTEVAVIYYGFVNWKTRTLRSNEFSYHKKSGAISLLAGLLMIVAIETLALHFLLAQWSPVLAWVLTVLSIYSAMQVFGCIKSMSRRPILIEDNLLSLRYGIMSQTSIELANIESITLSKKPIATDKLSRKLSPLGEMDSHNVVLQLKKEKQLIGFYGIKRSYTSLAFYVDEPERFVEYLKNSSTVGAGVAGLD